MPSGKLRKALRAAGHHLDPVVQIGKEGLSAALLAELDAQLLAHELVKVKVGTESPDDRFGVADRLAGEAGTQVAQVLGRTVLVYRRHPERPRFEPGEAKPAAAREPAATRKPGRKPTRRSPTKPRRGPARGARR
jgi:RNA-binding protein